MKYLFGFVYVLVLATQLPHIWSAYASLEDVGLPLAQWTALGAAIAFELSIGVFTFRVIKGNRRAWTKRGLLFFIIASVVANAYYYRVWPFAFDWLMPLFATLALPVALALFAEEFGAEVKRDERIAKRLERRSEQTPNEPEQPPEQPELLEKHLPPFACQLCGVRYDTRQALAGHMNAHRRKENER